MLRDRMGKNVEARAEVHRMLVLEFELPGTQANWSSVSGMSSERQLEQRGGERWGIKVNQANAFETASVLHAVADAIVKAMEPA